MKFNTNIVVAGLVTLFALAGTSYAHPGSYSGSVTIERLGQLKRNDMQRYSNPSKYDLDEVAQKLSASVGLASELERHSVQLNNVVKITNFQNGSVLVYVK